MKLYTESGDLQALKVLVAVKITKTSVTVETCSEKPTDSPEPLPVLQVPEESLWLSPNAAARYLFSKAGPLTNEDAETDTLSWESRHLLPTVSKYSIQAFGGQGKKDEGIASELTKTLQFLESKLAKTNFLSGDKIGPSDVCVFATVGPLFLLKVTGLFETLPNVRRWLSELESNNALKEAVSEVTGQSQDAIKVSLLRQAKNITLSKVSPDEIAAVLAGLKASLAEQPTPRVRKHPILPQKGERNIMVTSALPYVNNVPHLGNIIGCVLSGDVYSRYARLRNYNVMYLCGTDEYGTATETKALEEGLTPREICDKYSKLHIEIYKWFNIDFDTFGRTTTEAQTEISQDIFWKLYNEGYVTKDTVEQLKCAKCDKFLADRFVEGTCPLCGFHDARGDQCDKCGRLINAVELINPQCKICRATPILQTSNHLFVDLPKLEPKLREHLDKVFETGTWTHNSHSITTSWLRDGIKTRCITRDLTWGTPVPLEGYTHKVFYVWFDAPIGYISITANYTDKWEQWWKNPQEVEMYNFLGKDNVPFHSVVFPACLIGANDNYTLVNHMIATEYLNYEDAKFSKSRGTGVFGDDAATTDIPADIYRFYLLYLRPESQDTIFSWDDLTQKVNNELLNNLGNFINRALSFLANHYDGKIQPIVEKEDDLQFLALVTRALNNYISNLEVCKIKDGVSDILSISRLGNQYLQSNKPWALIKGSAEDKERAGTIVSLCVNVCCLLSVILHPYMPETSAKLQEQLRAPATVNVITDTFVPQLSQGHQIGKPSPLFQKIEASVAATLKARFSGKQ